METFREAFASRTWPIIKQTFEQWKALDVVKQDDGAIGGHFGVTKVLEACAKNGECRNQACNAAWVLPAAASVMGGSLTVGMVAKASQLGFRDQKAKGQPLAIPKVCPKHWSTTIGIMSLTDRFERKELRRCAGDIWISAFWYTVYEVLSDANMSVVRFDFVLELRLRSNLQL